MTITQRDRDLGTAYAMKPAQTRTDLLRALNVATRYDEGRPFKTGVLQV